MIFNKSRTFTIIKSLATSPIGICIYSIITFYTLYVINIYLIDEQILALPNPDASKMGYSIFLIMAEFVGLVIIITLLTLGFIIIYETKLKLDKDIHKYESVNINPNKKLD